VADVDLFDEMRALRTEVATFHAEQRAALAYNNAALAETKAALAGTNAALAEHRVAFAEHRLAVVEQLDDIRARLVTLFDELTAFRAEYREHTHGD